MPNPDPDPVLKQADLAAAEAGAIGGSPSSRSPSSEDEPVDEAQRPLDEAGQGESEGFEKAERELIEHSSHGDQHAARHVIGDAPALSEDVRGNEGGEGDLERSSERDEGVS